MQIVEKTVMFAEPRPEKFEFLVRSRRVGAKMMPFANSLLNFETSFGTKTTCLSKTYLNGIFIKPAVNADFPVCFVEYSHTCGKISQGFC